MSRSGTRGRSRTRPPVLASLPPTTLASSQMSLRRAPPVHQPNGTRVSPRRSLPRREQGARQRCLLLSYWFTFFCF